MNEIVTERPHLFEPNIYRGMCRNGGKGMSSKAGCHCKTGV